MRVALKIAYGGRAFHGFARQPDVRTVEGEILFVLRKSRLAADIERANVRGASRTDAGVSALGNVVAFDTDAPLEDVPGRFNHAAKDVWAWGVAEASPGFNPRHARQRWYRYLVTDVCDIARLRRAAAPFVGTHDFGAFSDGASLSARRRVDSVEVTPATDGVLIDVRAPRFLRGMVRRMVAAMLAVGRGEASIVDLETALSVGKGPDFGLVSADPLVLMDVDVGIPFRPSTDRGFRYRARQRYLETIVAARFWSEASSVRPGLSVIPASAADHQCGLEQSRVAE
jgi:tRNA pseudouridine38-40 synthase